MKPEAMNKNLWWVVFLGSTFSLSFVLHTFKAFTVSPNIENGLALAGALLMLGATFLVLLYDGYVKEKAKSNVHHPFVLFEWVYNLQSKPEKVAGESSWK